MTGAAPRWLALVLVRAVCAVPSSLDGPPTLMRVAQQRAEVVSGLS